MGIKSTTELKRSDALEMYAELLKDLYGIEGPTNEELGNLLDRLHDLKCERDGRTSFDNFLVIDDFDHEWRRDY